MKTIVSKSFSASAFEGIDFKSSVEALRKLPGTAISPEKLKAIKEKQAEDPSASVIQIVHDLKCSEKW